ncbi:DNA mismatch repair protein [Ophidiomyces ophidiicola]|nr:DNA mismatch repair protein [Ophidiomyces ophidiicola]
MTSSALPIRPLPTKVAAQIKSSTTIISLNSVVLELVKNSLDAAAHTIAVTVDYQKGGCVVEDDGIGIPSLEFKDGGGLGKLYHTSKFECTHEVYGRSGIFLSSLASLALVSITSRHRADATTNSVTYHQSNTISRLCPAPAKYDLAYEHGTKVIVTNLFGNLPVRVKHRALSLQRNGDIDKEWDELTRLLTSLLIAFQNPIKLIFEDSSKSRKTIIRGRKKRSDQKKSQDEPTDRAILDIAQVASILSQVGYISSTEFGSWVSASARASGISVRSAISLVPSPTKQVQFISFGINPLNQQSNANVLYDEINRLFTKSSFGAEDYCPPEIADELQGLNLGDIQKGGRGQLEKGYRAHAKGVNRWPMFYIRIDLKKQSEIINEKSGPLSSEKSLENILSVLNAMICQFLEQYNFSTPRCRRGEKRPQENVVEAENKEYQPSKRPKCCTTTNPAVVVGDVQTTQEDFLNPLLKLPNRPQSSRMPPGTLRPDLASWSRIKAGKNKDILEEICGGLPRRKSKSITSLDKLPDSESGEGRRLKESLRPASFPTTPIPTELCESTPLDHTALETQTETLPPTVAEADSIEQDPSNHVIAWMSPVSKKVLHINKRTGQTMPLQSTGPIPFRPISATSQFSVKSKRDHSQSPAPTPWIDSVLQNWENPVFRLPEYPIPSLRPATPIHPEQGDNGFAARLRNGAGNTSDFSFSFNGRLTKARLAKAKVLAQVDKKFILLRMAVLPSEAGDDQQVLVLVDQHAADERINVEQLFIEVCSQTVDTTSLSQPISFKVSSQEAQLFTSQSDYFASWGCLYSVSREETQSQYSAVKISALPTLIYERCRTEPKLAIDMLRSEIWMRKDAGVTPKPRALEPNSEPAPWPQLISQCPRGIIELLSSRACRSSIMFNDKLRNKECGTLITKLAQCVFPFYCAHGRPSMVPILNLGTMCNGDTAGIALNDAATAFGNFAEHEKDAEQFAQAYMTWRHNQG